MSDQKKSKQKWLRLIVARMDRAYKVLPEPVWLRGDWPMWVTNVAREFSKAVYPTAKLKVSSSWEPGEVGALIGQQIAYTAYDFTAEINKVSGKKVPWAKLRTVFGKDIKERVTAFEQKFEKKFVPDLARALKFAVGLAIEQDYQDCAKFFAAFGRAIQRKPSSAGDIGRTNTQIYLFLLVFWRSVEKLGSIPKLHELLCKTFGTHIVGTIKRIEKICERIGLSYPEIAERKALAEKSPKIT